MKLTDHDPGFRAGTLQTWEGYDSGGPFGERSVHVWVPRGLPADARLPVLYLHDGDVVFHRGGPAGKTWGLPDTLDALAGQIPPVLVVAIVPNQRDYAYTHVDWRAGRRPFGGLPAHSEDLATRIKPWIDDTYPTDPRPGTSAVAGSSHGGLAAFYTGAAWPSVFGVVGALSPSFFAGLDDLDAPPGLVSPSDRRLDQSPLWLESAGALRDPDLRPRVFLSWGLRRHHGDHDRVVEGLATARGREMASLLREIGYQDGRDLAVLEDPLGGHDEDAWRWQIGQMLRWWLLPT